MRKLLLLGAAVAAVVGVRRTFAVSPAVTRVAEARPLDRAREDPALTRPPAPPAVPRLPAPAALALALDEPVEDDGLTAAERRAGMIAEAVDRQSDWHGVIHGCLRGARSGELLPGVTVIVTSAGAGQLAAISDEQGCYVLEGVPRGTQTTTFYYLDFAMSHSTEVVEREATEVDLALAYPGPDLDLVD